MSPSLFYVPFVDQTTAVERRTSGTLEIPVYEATLKIGATLTPGDTEAMMKETSGG